MVSEFQHKNYLNISSMADAKEETAEDILKTIFEGVQSNEWSPSETIQKLGKHIDRLKSEMKEYLNGCKFDIEELANESQQLNDEGHELYQDLQLCIEKTEQTTLTKILETIAQMEILLEDLRRAKFTLNIMFDVVEMGRYLIDYEEARKERKFIKAHQMLRDMMKLITNCCDGVGKLTMTQNYKVANEVHRADFMEVLHTEWNNLMSWSVESEEKEKVVTIKSTIVPKDREYCIELLIAYDMCQELKPKFEELGAILKEIIHNMVHYDSEVTKTNDDQIVMKIHMGKMVDPNFEMVLENVRMLFEFLAGKLNFQLPGGPHLMKEYLGNNIRAEVADVLMSDCFIKTIPNNINELQNYEETIAKLREFQKFLIDINFFPAEGFSVLSYVDDIEELFARKSSSYFLEKARDIIMKDLSASMSIGLESIPEDKEDICSNDDPTSEALKILNNNMPCSLFFFPRCMISKSTQELLDLILVIMEQASQCSDSVSRQLYLTTRLIFEMYEAVTPYHHEKYLQTIPQYVALFHNNCMYLSHNMQTLGERWSILMEDREPSYPVTFVDLVQKIRDLGYKHLTMHMQQQRKQILDNIRSSDLNSIVVREELGESAEQAVRQCLRQLQLLSNVWQGVFPSNVYTNLMATLVNMLIEELIHRVCTVEDIPAHMATQLTEIYTIVVKKAPKLFQCESDIEQRVQSWTKLQELILILGGSLRDIERRWVAGVLAQYFRPEELRALVKALFQNTQMRASLLAKIK